MSSTKSVKDRFDILAPYLNEKITRLWAAIEATTIGRGGIALVSKATGLSPKTIRAGIRELEQESDTPLKQTRKLSQIRKQGGGRKRLTDINPSLAKDLEALMNPVMLRDSQSILYWTCKSTAEIASELQKKGYSISSRKVADLLHQLNYSLSNRKTKQGNTRVDRDTQFQYIHDQVQDFLNRAQPVISVDMIKKEVIEAYEDKEQDLRFKNQSAEFIFYGNDKQMTDAAWRQVSIDNYTVEFGVKYIRQWWLDTGQRMYLDATELLLIDTSFATSNRYPVSLWKTELQKFANQLGIKLRVAHFPPGIRKWNKIEHRVFCQLTEYWREHLPISREVVINLIGNVSIQKLSNDKNNRKLYKVEQKKSNLHKNWNYLIVPVNDLEPRSGIT